MFKKIWNEMFPKHKNDYFYKKKEPTNRVLRKLINTLENENTVLKDAIEEKLFKQYLKKVGESEEIKKLKKENKKLREKIKELKETKGSKK